MPIVFMSGQLEPKRDRTAVAVRAGTPNSARAYYAESAGVNDAARGSAEQKVAVVEQVQADQNDAAVLLDERVRGRARRRARADDEGQALAARLARLDAHLRAGEAEGRGVRVVGDALAVTAVDQLVEERLDESRRDDAIDRRDDPPAVAVARQHHARVAATDRHLVELRGVELV